MRLSSTAIVALFTLLALRPAHAQTSLADAPQPSAATTPAEPEQAAVPSPEIVATPAPSGEPSPATPPPRPGVPSAPSAAHPTASRSEQGQESTRSSDAAPDGDQSDARTPGVRLEEPRPSQGHFLAVGLHGVGAMAFDKSRGTRDPTFGTGFTLRLGESLTNWLSLSLSLALGFTDGKPRDSLTFGRFGVTSQWYFTERWFAQAGFAAAYVQGPDPEDHKRSRGRYGDVYLTGIGRDFYLSNSSQSGGWVITPLLTADVGPGSDFTATSMWLGIELSWWSGLTQDKLNLPASKAYTKE